MAHNLIREMTDIGDKNPILTYLKCNGCGCNFLIEINRGVDWGYSYLHRRDTFSKVYPSCRKNNREVVL